MTTFEEDVVEVYYNFKGYFTIKNIHFPAIKKRRGGAGRGEIDLLSIKVKDNKIIDAVRTEISVSITSTFPFKSETYKFLDESNRLIKKFFRADYSHKIREYIGNTKYRSQLITSRFDKKITEKLRERLKRFGANVLDISEKKEKVIIKLSYGGKIETIEIIPFERILNELRDIFKEKNLSKRHFQDPRIRGLQYLINAYNNTYKIS